MAESERITSADDRTVARLVAECRELGTDAAAWQTRLVEGVRRMTNAMTVTTGPVAVFDQFGQYAAGCAELGWPSPEVQARWHEWLKVPANVAEHPASARFVGSPGASLTRTRRQLVPDREWNSSPFVNDRLRPDGMDDGLLSRVGVPVAGVVYTTVIMRPVERRVYSPRDARLVERLHAALAPHLGRSLLVTTQPNLTGLSPRLRQLVGCLLDGDSEKQAAARLFLRPSTVHDYVKRLYRHFEVHSRPELIAYFLRASAATRPGAESLPPRLAELLRCLLDGDSEKRAAKRLGLQPTTVHDYATRIHRHFGVHSRAELLAHFLRRGDR